MKRIRKDDEVIVLAGRDKGKRGKVLEVNGEKAVVAGVNIVKKHQKPNPQREISGGIIEKEAPIHLSNIALFDSETGKAGRVGFRLEEGGTKVRFFKGSGRVVGN